MKIRNVFLPGLSVRGFDPRVLLLAAAGTAFCVSAIRNIAVAAAALVLAMLFCAMCAPAWRILARRLLAANFFILFLWLTVPWTMPGTVVLTLGPLDFSEEGLALAALVSLKCNAMLLVFLVLVADMDLPLMGCALERLHVPAKLVFLFLFTWRYIHVVGEEWKKMWTAAALRGFVPRTSPHSYATMGSMLGLTVVNSIDRSHRIYEAMLLRCFSGRFHVVAELEATTRDIVFAVFFLFILVCLLFADICMVRCNA